METVYENRQWWDEAEHKPEPYIAFTQYRSYSPFPYIVRDITLPKGSLLSILSRGGRYLERVDKIGEYKPKNNETFRLIFQSKYRNLTNEEIDQVMSVLQ